MVLVGYEQKDTSKTTNEIDLSQKKKICRLESYIIVKIHS